MLPNLSYRLGVLVILSTFDSCFFHGLSYLIFVRNIYHKYHNTINDGHIYVILLVILWQSFQLQDQSWYAHITVFGLKTLHDNAHNLTHLKIFQGSVSSCLLWRPALSFFSIIIGFFGLKCGFLIISGCFFGLNICICCCWVSSLASSAWVSDLLSIVANKGVLMFFFRTSLLPVFF